MDIGGQMFVVIPQPALTPIRQQLSRDLSSDGSASDPRWLKMMQRGRAKGRRSRSTGILDESDADARRHRRAGASATCCRSKPTALTQVRLDCKSQPLFWCELGQAKGITRSTIAERVNVEEMPLAQFLNMAGRQRKALSSPKPRIARRRGLT